MNGTKWWDHFCKCVIPNWSTAIPKRDYLLWLDFWVFYFAFIVIFFHLWKTNRPLFIYKRPVYIFAFGEYNSKQVNVSAIKYFLAQFKGLELRTENLNAATNYLFGIIFTKCKYMYIQVFCFRTASALANRTRRPTTLPLF